ncbi:MAG TPA: alpha/beta hydrolase [Patescibacteria group bacterium]
MNTYNLAKFRAKKMKIKGINWNYYDLGRGEKTIVILPNILVFPSPWFEYAKFLETKSRIIIPVYPPISDYGLMVEMLHLLLIKLGVKKFVMVGNSVGGIFAQIYQSRFPKDLEGLILIATIAPNKFFGFLATILYSLGKFAPDIMIEGFVYVGTYFSLTSNKKLNNFWLPLLKDHIFQKQTKKSILALGFCIISFCFGFKNKNMYEIPVSIINAKKDIVFHPFFQNSSKSYPKAKNYDIPDARHLLELSSKDTILQIIQNYL